MLWRLIIRLPTLFCLTLSPPQDTPTLYVDRQEIKGFVGGEITIKCYNRYPGEIKWCGLGSSCVMGSAGSIEVNK